jgi:regulatory protein
VRSRLARDRSRPGAASAGDDSPAGARPPRDANPSLDIRHAALDLLARREHSTAELRERLSRKLGHDAALIEAALEQLATEGLLDDTRFSESFIRMHRRKGHGPLRILHELRQRGVDGALAEELVDARGDEWIELARDWRARRFGAAEPRSTADWQRQARHLQTRGFSTEQVRRAMRSPED